MRAQQGSHYYMSTFPNGVPGGAPSDHIIPWICIQLCRWWLSLYLWSMAVELNQKKHSLKNLMTSSVQFSSVQSLSHVWLFAIPWITACQASLSITNSRSSLKLTSIESVMPSSHLILHHPLFLLLPIPPSIRVFSNESTSHEVAKVLEFQL